MVDVEFTHYFQLLIRLPHLVSYGAQVQHLQTNFCNTSHSILLFDKVTLNFILYYLETTSNIIQRTS